MKKGLLILLCLPMIGFGQLTMIPDANFEQALINLGYDTGTPNGSVYTASIDTVTSLNVDNQNIADLTGIEDFASLDILECQSNNLTSLDVSNNTALVELACHDNQLTSLDVSTNTALIILHCYYNQLTSLDVSGTALTGLYCYENQLTSLDVSNNTALVELECDNNQLTSLDVSTNTALNYLHCYYNQLTSLNVSNNTALIDLDFSDNQLTILDISSNILLEFLGCSDNQIVNLNVSNNIVLKELWCSDNQLTSLDISQNINLNQLSLNTNPLISLNVQNGNNTNLYCDYIVPLSCGGIQFITSLSCIQVDDIVWAYLNWTGSIDTTFQYFSANCSAPSSIEENATNKELLKVTDLLGRETKQTNQPLLYIYDDGTVEKSITIE